MLLKDTILDSYFPYNPAKEIYNDLWISANSRHLFLLYDDEIVITYLNFYYLTFSSISLETNSPVRLECVKIDDIKSQN